MKKIFILCAIVVSFSGCKKTVEALSMIGTWAVDSYYDNGADQTTFFKNLYVNYRIKFDVSGNYTETATVLGVNQTNGGPWKLINNGDDLELTNQTDNSKRYFHIIEIKPNTSKVSEGTHEYHLLKQ